MLIAIIEILDYLRKHDIIKSWERVDGENRKFIIEF